MQEIKVSFLIIKEIWREVTTILLQLINFEYSVQLFTILKKEEIVTIETTKSYNLHDMLRDSLS